MKKGFALGAALGTALSLSAGIATAGGLDRSGQSITAIFEEGNYVELSFGYVMPSVSGEFGLALSGDVTPAYSALGFAFTQQINDKLSFGLIFDQPFGANIDYTDSPGWPTGLVSAELSSISLTALGRYRINENISVIGGLRLVSMSGTIELGGPTFDYAASTDVGYVVGAAYEIPAIALRAALTYSSATNFENPATSAGGPFPPADIPAYSMPQSINLDFQTGIAADTLLMASVRWADWTETVLVTPLGLIDYDEDVFTYSIGVGRRFSDAFSGSIALGYEKSQGGLASNLSPTDGFVSLTVGGAYTLESGIKLSGGVRFVKIGDATTEIFGGDFSDNTAIAIGLKVSTSF